MKKLTFDQIDICAELSGPIPKHLSYSPEGINNHHWFLGSMVFLTQPKLVLEIGVHTGIGSNHMATAASTYGGHVAGVDVHPAANINTLNRYGNYTFLPMDSTGGFFETTLEKLANEYGPLGVVFQDSSHHYEASQREWETCQPFLDENAIWICDDITPAFQRPGLDEGSMVDYFNQLPGEKKLYDNLHHGSAIGVVLT